MSLWDELGGAINAWLKSPKILVSLRFQWTGFTKGKKMPPEYKYFNSPEDLVRIRGLNEEYVAKLDMSRAKTIEIDEVKRGLPTVITSGLRTPEKNQSILGSGAVADSSHLKGVAIDQAVSNDHEVFLAVASLIAVGITRIGIYVDADNNPTHVHNDVDPDKVQQVIWIKREGQPNSPPATV